MPYPSSLWNFIKLGQLSKRYCLFKTIFSSNFYPQFLLDNVLSKYLISTFCPKVPVMSVPKLPIFITLPYIGNSSHHCKKQLLNIVNKYFPQVNLRWIFINRNTVGSLFPFKDQIPLMMSSNIIYKYSCSQCQSTYIAETQRHLISRICEHKGISPRTNMPFSNPPLSNIREHALSFDHPIKVDNFSVLARCPSHDLRLLESIFIHKFSPNLNNQASSFPLQIISWGITFFYGYIFSNFSNSFNIINFHWSIL